MKIISYSNNSYDFFFGDGWANCIRVRSTYATYIYASYGIYPVNYMDMIENHVKSQKLAEVSLSK
jgi:hypothetical protein